MSRSTLPKSRAEKGKAPSTTPAVAHEIIPGKYNDQDWSLMLDHDEGDEFVCDIVEEVCSSAMDIIYGSYIQRQLVPYTVLQAKDAILQIIEWQFLARDSGELNVEEDEGWIQDEEPEPAVTDCWAQGSVPKQRVTQRPPSIMEVDDEPEPLEDRQPTQMTVDEETDVVEDQTVEPPGEEDSLCMEESEDEPETPETIPETQQKEDSSVSKKKRGYKPRKGRLPSAGLNKMTESLEDTEMKMLQQHHVTPPTTTPDPDSLQMPASCHSMLKLQAGRPPGNRDVLFDEQGNVIAVYKLDPEKLPNHKVRTGFRVIDPAIEAAQARLEAMRTGRHVGTTTRQPKPPSTNKPTGTRNTGLTTKTSSKTHTVSTSYSKYTGKDPKSMEIAPLPPPMIDTMELMPGVIVKEGDRMKKGPRQYNRKMEAMLGALHRNLKPMSGRADLPTLTVAELLEHQTPVVKPLVDNTPIPPIQAQMQYS